MSGGNDKTVRMWDAATREQIGDPLIGHTDWLRSVAESLDGRFVVSRAWIAQTIIWDRDSRVIIWNSDDANNAMTNDEAESIIRSCSCETRQLWPSCFPEYSPEIYCEEYSVYSNVVGERISIGNLPSEVFDWKYDGVVKVFAAGLRSGDVAICRLVE